MLASLASSMVEAIVEGGKGRLLDTGHFVSQGGRLLDTRRLFESGGLFDHLRYVIGHLHLEVLSSMRCLFNKISILNK